MELRPGGRADGAPEPQPLRRLGNVAGFDGLRGVAVIIVFVAHLDVILPIPSLLVVPGGTVSLDSFFVLSGFLITALLLREQSRNGGVDKRGFYQRRALRLLPALVAVLVAQGVLAYLTGVSFHEEWTSQASVLFYYSNWKLALSANAFGGNIAPGLQHLWSLSFEEQFYLVWPWVVAVLLTVRMRLRTVVIILLSLIALIAVHRALSYHGLANWYSIFVRTDTRADAILWGCLLAHVWMRAREPKRGVVAAAWIASAFLLVCLPLADLTGPFLYRGGLVAIDAACAVLILAIVDGRWIGRHLFQLRPFVLLGIISYAFYLWHLPVFFAIRYYGVHWNDVTRVVVAVTVTLGLAIASWFLLERPALRWKARIEARRAEQATAPPQPAAPQPGALEPEARQPAVPQPPEAPRPPGAPPAPARPHLP